MKPEQREPVEFTAAFLFAGLGAGARGFLESAARLSDSGARFRSLGGVDVDPEACADFEKLTGSRATRADVATMTADELRAAWGERVPDCVFMSPPCLPGRGLVLTEDGPRRIETIRANDLVLTHRGRLRRVLKVGSHQYIGEMIALRLNGTIDVQEFTAEHPVWVRRGVRKNGRRQLGEGAFMEATRVRVGDRVGFPIEPEDRAAARRFVESFGDPRAIQKGGRATGRYAKPRHTAHISLVRDLRPDAESEHLWFLFGFYLGDGYRQKNRGEVCFCVGEYAGDIASEVTAALEALNLPYSIDTSAGEGNVKVRVASRHLWTLVGAFGDGAAEKRIPPQLMGLAARPLAALIHGYRQADGSEDPRRRQGGKELQARWKIASTSLQLLRDVQRLLLRMGEYGAIHRCWPGGPQTIDTGTGSRVVQTRPRWTLTVARDPRKRTVFEFSDGAVWVRVRKVERRTTRERVWNLEVEEDNTFCAPMMATHNCKGFSGLLSAAAAQAPKYQRLNELVVQGVALVCRSWSEPPALLVIENVPRITSRGAPLLHEVKKLLRGYGYLLHDGHHECGELGGLAQRRRRYLLVARRPARVPGFVYQPEKKKLRACGDVLGPLPMPGDSIAGPMHALPKIRWINWVRLALIPAGGDWRDLPGGPRDRYAGGQRRVTRWEEPTGAVTGSREHGATSVADERPREYFGGAFGVQRWDEPARSVIGGPSNGASAVADPRLPLVCPRCCAALIEQGLAEPGAICQACAVGLGTTGRNAGAWKGRPGMMRVQPWEDPTPAVVGATEVAGGHGTAAVADPRPFAPDLGPQAKGNLLAVTPWDRPAGTVIGATRPGSGAASVADPRAFKGGYGVQPWDQPTDTVTGEASPSTGRFSVADPRVEWFKHCLRVGKWDEPVGTITSSPSPSSGAAAVADPRLGLPENAGRHWSKFAVDRWSEPARTITGARPVTSGGPAVADPRLLVPKDGTYKGKHGVMDWREPARSVIGGPSNGADAVADPRVPFNDAYKVNDWEAPAVAVTGGRGGGPAVADPRLGCTPRNGSYGVVSWAEAAATITGVAQVDNGPFSVADPRVVEALRVQVERGEFPLIISDDGTWHRPLTTLELAVLQGLPPILAGAPLALAGVSTSRWRERIGNAVPVGAARAIGDVLLTALLAGSLGRIALSAAAVWVRGTFDDGALHLEAC